MSTLTAAFEVTRDTAHREVFYRLSGLFTQDKVDELFAELFSASQPFIEDKGGFRVIGDLREISVQTREISDRIRFSQESSARAGVTKMAIVYSSILVMQQFRRNSEALNLGLFEDMDEAYAWLRSKD
ncbi:MAG: STAS/SEC14 domain-containing protein [Pseudomonadota bacterium]